MKDWIFSAIASVVLGTVGWWIGAAMLAPGSEAHVIGDPRTVAHSEPTTSSTNGDTGLVSEAIDRVEAAVKKSGSSTELTIRLFEEAQHFKAEDFPHAIALAKHDGNRNIASLLVGYWAERNLESAKKWMLGLQGDESAEAASEVAATWGRANPTELLDWLETLPNETRAKIVSNGSTALVQSAGLADPQRVVRLLTSIPQDRTRENENLGALFDLWTAKSPVLAAQNALALPAGGARTDAVLAVAKAWANLDAKAAGAWVRGLTDAVLAGRATAAYARGLASKNPRAAAEFVGDLAPTLENIQTFKDIAKEWGGNNPAQAIAWADAIADEKVRGEVIDVMFSAMAKSDLPRAAREYPKHSSQFSDEIDSPIFKIAEELVRTRGIDDVVQFGHSLPEYARLMAVSRGVNIWASEDPKAATDWVLRQPDDDSRSDMLYQIAIYKVNSNDGGAWALSLPRTPSSDQARMYEAEVLFRRDASRKDAITLFSQVSDQEGARTKLSTAAYWWMRSDPVAAKAWVESSNLLTAEDKAKLLQQSR